MYTDKINLKFLEKEYPVYIGSIDDEQYMNMIIQHCKNNKNLKLYMDIETTYQDNNKKIYSTKPEIHLLENKPCLIQLKFSNSDTIYLIDVIRPFNTYPAETQQYIINKIQEEKKEFRPDFVFYSKAGFVNFKKFLKAIIENNHTTLFHNGNAFDLPVLLSFYSLFDEDYSTLLNKIKEQHHIDTRDFYLQKIKLQNEPNKSSLAYLVEKYIGYKMDKTYQTHDWTIRPFDAKAIKYAALDVVLLDLLENKLLEKYSEKQKKYKETSQALETEIKTDNNIDPSLIDFSYDLLLKQYKNLLEHLDYIEDYKERIEKVLIVKLKENNLDEVVTSEGVISYKITEMTKRTVNIPKLIDKYATDNKILRKIMQNSSITIKDMGKLIENNILPSHVLEDGDVVEKKTSVSKEPKLKIKLDTKETNQSAEQSEKDIVNNMEITVF